MESEEEEAENCLSRGRPEPSGTIRNHLEGPRGEIRSGGVARNHLQVAPTPWGAHACPSRRSRWRSKTVKILYCGMRSKGPCWALLPAPSLESFATQGPSSSRREEASSREGFKGASFGGLPAGSLPHILSEVRQLGVRGASRRTVGPPSSIESVERMVRPAFPHVGTPGPPPGLDVVKRLGGLFCDCN